MARKSAKTRKMAERQEIGLGTLVTWINESDDATVWARSDSEKCRDYYDSRQISEAEARAMKARKQAPVVINRIKPKIDGLAGMERANRTTAKCYPRTPRHDQGADAATEAIRYVLTDQFWNQKRSIAWDFLCVEGSGMIEVIARDEGENPKIILNPVPWDRIVHDPFSRRKDFSDSRFLGQVIWMDYDEAAQKWPDSTDALESMMTGSQTFEDRPQWVDTVRKRVKVVELWWRESQTIMYATFTRGGYLVEPRESPYIDEEGNREWPYEAASLFVDRDGNRYGAVRQYLDVQDEINKRRSKALHLISVRQVKVFKGAVDDVNKVRNELARPDGVVEVNTSEPSDFEVLKTGDMAAAQFNLLQEAKNEIDAVGYNAAASGKETRLMSGIALKNREIAAQTEIAPMFDVLRHMDIRVYRKIWNRIRQYWRAAMWLRVTDDEANMKWVGLNTEDGAKIEELDVDIVIDDAPDSPTMQVEQFQVLGEIIKSGAPPALIKAMIQASPMPHKDRLLKELSGPNIPPELQQQMQKMQEDFKALQEENQQLKAGVQVDMQKIGAQREAKMAELQVSAQVQAEELRLAREKAQAEIEIERMKLASEVQMQGERAKLDEEKMTREAGLKERTLDFDMQCRARDDEAKSREQAAKEALPLAQNVLPQVMQVMAQMMQSFTEALEQIARSNLEGQQLLAKAISEPRAVSLGDIRRDESGQLVAACATSRTMQ